MIDRLAEAVRAGFAARDRDRPAGEELRRFAGNRGDRRLGQGARHALLFVSLQRRRERCRPPMRQPIVAVSIAAVPLIENGLVNDRLVRPVEPPVSLRFKPSCLMMSRRISEMVTRKLT